jgi:hypothetical protein
MLMTTNQPPLEQIIGLRKHHQEKSAIPKNHIATDLPAGRPGRSITMALVTTELPADRSGRTVATGPPQKNYQAGLVVLM